MIDVIPISQAWNNNLTIQAYAKRKKRLYYRPAYKYAMRHNAVWKYNKAYSRYSDPQKSLNFPDDCTNYVSQIMRHSGAKVHSQKVKHGLRNTSTKQWFLYKKNGLGWAKYSTSWTTVVDFYKHWTKYGHKGHYTRINHKNFSRKQRAKTVKMVEKRAKLGDIIQFRRYRNHKYEWFHSGFVDGTYKKKKHGHYVYRVYYASHTSNIKHRNLSAGLASSGANGVRLIHMEMR